ncbi:MAG: glycosyltransferase family 2 protein [Patescibacteria group bacterium]|nr:glycosyltransferase family 2 protein [Patescibacteria group bacterium]
MSEIDVSILIVHTYEKKLLRQTLRSIRRAAPKISYEVVIIDNNPAAGMEELLNREFSDAVYIKNEKNIGFGGAMNVGIRGSRGRYVLIFNPDIVVHPGSLETMVEYMDLYPDVGIVGPQLLNPDGSLQYSCYALPTLMQPVYRRTPLGKTESGKRSIAEYLMMNVDHSEEMNVDSLIGAALFTRRSTLEEVGLFDERFFMYYEDNDLCRRFWKNGHMVVYLPKAKMTHYHRRASADGGLFKQLTNRFTWIHMNSFVKYIKKYKGQENPRLKFEKEHGGV